MRHLLLHLSPSADVELSTHVLPCVRRKIVQVFLHFTFLAVFEHRPTFSENYQDDISCAVCRQTSQFPRGVLSKLPRNHVVVDMLEKCGVKDCLMSQKQVHKLLTDVSDDI